MRLTNSKRIAVAMLVTMLVAAGCAESDAPPPTASSGSGQKAETTSPSTTVAAEVAAPVSSSLFRMERVVSEVEARTGSWIAFGVKSDPGYPENSALIFGSAILGDGEWQVHRRSRAWCTASRTERSDILIPKTTSIIVKCDQRGDVPDSSVYIAASPILEDVGSRSGGSDPDIVLGAHCGVTDFKLVGNTIVITSKTPKLNSDLSSGEGYTTNPDVPLTWDPDSGFVDQLPEAYCEDNRLTDAIDDSF